MCGRFLRHSNVHELAKLFQATWSEDEDIRPSYIVAPTQAVLAVRATPAGQELVWLRWGLIPQWSKEPKTHYSTINARAETVSSKPAYRQAFKYRRCLIPANGFYKWHQQEHGKQPYYIHLKNDQPMEPMAFVGLWEHWEKEGQVNPAASSLRRPIL